MNMYATSRRPRLLAHRGFCPTNSMGISEIPENSLAAFALAILAGATIIETDVQVSRDGVAYLFHDETVDRVTGVHGRIGDLTASEISALSLSGHQIPRLEHALELFPSMAFNLDVKTAAAVPAIVAAIVETRAQNRVLLGSFEAEIAALACSGITVATGEPPLRSASLAELATLRDFKRLTDSGATEQVIENWLNNFRPTMRDIFAVQVPPQWGDFEVLTAQFIDLMHEFGVEVHTWTIDDADEMRQLLNLGVDGIITNRMDLLTQVVNE